MDLGLTQTLLHELAMDDYVRFKYGKRIEAALRQLDQQAGGASPAELEAKLLELLDIVRGKPARGARKVAGESTPAAKSPREQREKRAKPHEPA